MSETLEQLAESLGVASEVLWEALLRQAPLAAAGWFAFALFILAVGTVIAQKLRQSVEADGDPEFGSLLGSFIVLIFGAVSIAIMIEEVVPGFFNPEYWAAQKILEALGG